MINLGERLSIRVPASTANLGSGFDCIGIAFQLYLYIRAELAEETSFHWKGSELEHIQLKGEENLILKAMNRVYDLLNEKKPTLKVEVESHIPLTRGLGSSASAYVGGLVLANELLQKPLTDEELLWLATEEEGHSDNVGASLFGGLFLGSVDWEKKKVWYHSQPFPSEFSWVAAIPSYPLSTSASRRLLPEQYSKSDTIYNLSRYGILVSCLLTGNRDGLAHGLEDSLHQPYRQKLIPGFSELFSLKESLGVIGFVISGAGPTILALVDKGYNATQLKRVMDQLMRIPNHTLDVVNIEVDQKGYLVERQKIADRSDIVV